MPGRDGSGPMGMGPKSGRGLGPCAGYAAVPSGGCGLGRGRGYRWIAQSTGVPSWVQYGYPTADLADPQQGKTFLENHARYLESQLEQVKSQLKKLE